LQKELQPTQQFAASAVLLLHKHGKLQLGTRVRTARQALKQARVHSIIERVLRPFPSFH